jgi:hypothetical protein
LFSASACGSNSNSDVNKVTRALALTARTFINFFQDNLKNCDAFLQIYNELTEEVQPCDNPDEGTFQVTKLEVTCTDGPPLIANAVFALQQTNCRDNGTDITSTGLINLVLDFSSSGNFGTLASEDLVAEGITFVFPDFVAKVDLSSNNLSCNDSGDLIADGDSCRVASNCRNCAF